MWVLHAEKKNTCLQNETGLQIQGTQCYQEKDQHAATCNASLAPSAQHVLLLMEASIHEFQSSVRYSKIKGCSKTFGASWHQASELEYRKNFILVRDFCFITGCQGGISFISPPHISITDFEPNVTQRCTKVPVYGKTWIYLPHAILALLHIPSNKGTHHSA